MSDDKPGQLRVQIAGLVQGVGFRHHTMIEANKLGLMGWVRNLPDGRVEALFEGPRATLATMIAWCHRGPYLSDVRSVKEDHRAATGKFSDFEIRF